MPNQFLRKIGLVVGISSATGLGKTATVATPSSSSSPGKTSPNASAGEQGIDLSALKIVFRVEAFDAESPPTALIRVYNVSDNTAKLIANAAEQQVTLQAGYESGNYGVIFKGTVVRTRTGRENNLNSFVDIMASDLDTWFNFGVVSKTLAAGSKLSDQLSTILASAQQSGAGQGSIPTNIGTGGTLPRGKVLFGLGRDRLSDVADSAGASWSIIDGQLQVIPLTGYAPGEAVQINSQTGMIGVPEATTSGIEVVTLLNPNIKLGTRVQLNNSDIVTTTTKAAKIEGQSVPVGFPSITGIQFFASLSADGFYRVIVAEHEGDSRGEPWYTKITCLSVDQSAAPSNSVPAYGGPPASTGESP
jgi:hypothetical protein